MKQATFGFLILFVLILAFCHTNQLSKQTIVFNPVTGERLLKRDFEDEVTAPYIHKPVFENGNVMWTRHSDYGIYESCDISAASGRIIAGTTDVYTPTNPDDAELIPLDSDGTPDWIYTGPNVQVAAQRNGNVVAATVFDDTDISLRVAKWTANGVSKNPDWTITLPTSLPTETAIAISKDGKKMAVLTSLLEFMNPNNTRMYFFDTSSSKIQQIVETTFGARHIIINGDGSLVAFHANTSIFVYNTNTKKFVWNLDVGYSDFNLAMSDDGKTLVSGFLSVDVYQWSDAAQTYQLSWSSVLPNHYVQTSTIANGKIFVGWSSYDALQPAVQVYSVASAQPLWTYQYAASSNLQNTPWGISATDDGNYFVVGTWGSMNTTDPEIRVWKTTSSNPIYELSAGGSVFAVDIASGSKPGILSVVAGAKAAHANVMGRGGNLYYAKIETMENFKL